MRTAPEEEANSPFPGQRCLLEVINSYLFCFVCVYVRECVSVCALGYSFLQEVCTVVHVNVFYFVCARMCCACVCLFHSTCVKAWVYVFVLIIFIPIQL